ncbi:MAG: acetyltransferase [Bacteroidota bacterium]
MNSPTPIVIIGNQGFAKEIEWLISDINRFPGSSVSYDFRGFIDHTENPTNENILGDDSWAINHLSKKTRFVIAIGNPSLRKKLADKYLSEGFLPATLIHPSVQLSESVSVGEGSLICAGVVMTVNIHLGGFCILNLNSTVGHGSRLGSFVTLAPGCHISGEVKIGSECELGTGAVVLPECALADSIILGAGAVATQNLAEAGTYVGVPARKISPSP